MEEFRSNLLLLLQCGYPEVITFSIEKGVRTFSLTIMLILGAADEPVEV